MRLEIVLCGNAETLGCSEDEAREYVDAMARVCYSEGLEYRTDTQFKTWNSGGASAPAYLHLTGWGRVESEDECGHAIGFCLSGGGNAPGTQVTPPSVWPSSDECERAFAALDEVREVSMEREYTLAFPLESGDFEYVHTWWSAAEGEALDEEAEKYCLANYPDRVEDWYILDYEGDNVNG